MSKPPVSTDLVRDVVVEAFGSSASVFVPLPFLDDWILARLFERVAAKIVARRQKNVPAYYTKTMVHAYLKAGEPTTKMWVLGKMARFALRKVSVVLDAKRSHDVFGETIAFAVAFDCVAERGWLDPLHGQHPNTPSWRAAPDFLGKILHAVVGAADTAVVGVIVKAWRTTPRGSFASELLALRQSLGGFLHEAFAESGLRF